MDLQSPFSLYTLILFFTTFFLFKFVQVKRSKTKNEAQNMPPGPWKLPLIGSILHLAGSLPHRILRDLAKKHEPLMHLQLGEISMIVISSPRVAMEVLKTNDLAFATRPEILATKIVLYNCTDIASAPYGGYWRQMRKITTLKLLSAKKVRSFPSIREEEVHHLIESIRSSSSTGSPVNLSQEIYSLTYKIVCRAAFGSRCKYEGTLKLLLNELVSSSGGFDVADLFPSLKLLHVVCGLRPKLEKLHQKIDQIMDSIIDECNKNLASMKEGNSDNTGEEDLLDVLLKVTESEDLEFPITSNNVKAVILDMFIAGTDTSLTIMEWAMSEMMKNPRVMDKAQAELRQALEGKKVIHETDIQGLSYLKMVIKETLRLYPSVPLLIPTECREECEINGYQIPIKTKAIVNAWAIGRDPEYWDDAESFVPERFENSSIENLGSNYEYIPFGAGRRLCPGYMFGLANVELPLAQLLYHCNCTLPPGQHLDMSESFGSAVKKRNALYLIATPHVALHSA